MRRAIILVIIGSLATAMVAQDSTGRFVIPVRNWELKLVGLDNFYPTYLADPLGIRFEVSSQRILYGDFEHFDPVNTEGTYLNKLVINPGVRISLFKFSPANHPELGVEVDLGVTVPTFMRGGNHDLIGVDGIYYFAVGGSPTEWLSLRFSKHHICTHIGDEFNTGLVSSVTDYDPNTTQLPVRDDFILSAAARPLWFLANPRWDILQVYGDFGFFLPGVDFMGTRQNKPASDAWLNLQGGTELEYYFTNRNIGGIFSAINVSAYQSNAFAPNISVSWGYILPQERDKRRIRIGLNYYNGRSLSNQFQNRKEKFIAFFVAMDV
jgi:hypothetical protein